MTTGVPMLWPTSTTRSALESFRTASTARANKSIDNLPSLGDPLCPWPGKSSVMTRYSLDSSGTCAFQVVSSHVQPCTRITVLGPFPFADEWILMPSTEAAESKAARDTASSNLIVNRIGEIIPTRNAMPAPDRCLWPGEREAKRTRGYWPPELAPGLSPDLSFA